LKFVADGMLGRLARWLRLLGHDTKYSNSMEDRQLLAIAQKERRILLTRDLQLYQRATAKGLDAFYVEGQTQAEKLAHIAKRFDIRLDIDMTQSRCPRCNATVKSAQKEEIRKKVEENTFSSYNDFWICPKCKQAYWQGAHWPKIRKILDTANRLLHDGKLDSERHRVCPRQTHKTNY
jgi:uncharacterized protein with PIN domain